VRSVALDNQQRVPAVQAPQPNGNHELAGSQLQPIADSSMGNLAGRLIADVSDLADRQIELARQEIAETRDQAVGLGKTFGIGAGILLTVALLLVIWAWTGFIWFFNWVGAFFGFGGLGWLLGLLVPVAAAFAAYKLFLEPGIREVKGLQPLARTRATLKENLEWARQLRTLRTR
jgi:hypothetical protein